MSYALAEASQAGSSPIELYEFTYQGTTLYFTSTEASVVIEGNTYVATQIDRTRLIDSAEVGKNTQTLTVPQFFPVSELFGAGPPDDIVTLKIKRYQPSASTDVQTIWGGRVTSVNWPPLRAEITCESIFTALRQSGIHRVFSVNCPLALYGRNCKANSGAFMESHVVDIQNGNLLTGSTLLTHPAGWWAGGKVFWEYSPGVFAKRGIKNQTGTQVEISFPFNSIPVGTACQFFAGCDHSFSTCGSKFANQPNYGGFPNMTQKNPWGGSSIF